MRQQAAADLTAFDFIKYLKIKTLAIVDWQIKVVEENF